MPSHRHFGFCDGDTRAYPTHARGSLAQGWHRAAAAPGGTGSSGHLAWGIILPPHMSSASGNSWPVLGSESGGGECCAEVDVCACRRRCRRCRRSHCDTSARRTEARTDKGRCDQTGSVGGTVPDSNTTGWDPRSATSFSFLRVDADPRAVPRADIAESKPRDSVCSARRCRSAVPLHDVAMSIVA